ncbi:MAG TPA: metallophosphoesterase [Rhodanobacteraceae bacterium]
MKLAVIGDIHGFWDARDTAYFNQSDYAALLFVGDFAAWTGSLPVARMLAGLTRPAWAIPGNHDAVTPLQLAAEIKHRRWLCALTGMGMERRVAALARALAPVRVGGYSLDRLDTDLGLLTARPHAMGPDAFHYRGYLSRRFGVAGFRASAELLKALVDSAPRRLIVLAHNGPAGLGATADAPFGNDFSPAGGDFGAPDLRVALDHARATGHQVLAVVAGHMHHSRRHAPVQRRTCAYDGATLCINAARVPRIRKDGSHRHHVALYIDGDAVRAETVFVAADGSIEAREPLTPVA